MTRRCRRCTGQSAGTELRLTREGSRKRCGWKLREYNCKAVCTWSSCDDQRKRVITHKVWENVRTSQLDFIPGQKVGKCAYYRHHDVKMCSTWDHCPAHVSIQEEEQSHFVLGKEDGWAGGKLVKEGRLIFKKKVMGE